MDVMQRKLNVKECQFPSCYALDNEINANDVNLSREVYDIQAV